MFCMNCGAEVENTDVFCANCGAQIKANSERKQTRETEAKNELVNAIANKKPIKIIKLVGGIIAFVLILSLICYTVYTEFIVQDEDYGTLSPEDIEFASESAEASATVSSDPIDVGTAEDFTLTNYHEYDGMTISVYGEFDMDRNGDMYIYGYNDRIILNGLNQEQVDVVYEEGTGWVTVTGEFYVDSDEILHIDVSDFIADVI